MKLKPARATPPGRIIQCEIDALGWRRVDLAVAVGMDENFVDDLIDGKVEWKPYVAQLLSEAFGTSEELWVALEANYRAYAECLNDAYGATVLPHSQFEAAMDSIAERHAAEDAWMLDDTDLGDE